MIKLSLKQVNERGFVTGLIQLSNSTKVDAKTAYRTGRILEACKKAMEACREKEKKTILDQGYAAMDAAGQVIYDEDPAGKFPKVDETKRQAFMAAFNHMMENSFITIKVHKIGFEEAAKAGLTPANLQDLAAIIDGCPEGEGTGEFEIEGEAVA